MFTPFASLYCLPNLYYTLVVLISLLAAVPMPVWIYTRIEVLVIQNFTDSRRVESYWCLIIHSKQVFLRIKCFSYQFCFAITAFLNCNIALAI